MQTNNARGFSWSAVTGPAVSNGKTWSATSQLLPCLVVTHQGKVAIKMVGQPEPDEAEVVAGNTMLVRDARTRAETEQGSTSAHGSGAER